MIEATTIQCPYCGESVSIEVDPTGGSSQEFETDCEVCCRPIVCAMQVEDGEHVRVAAHTESEV